MTTPFVHMTHYETDSIFSAFPREVRHAGRIPVEMAAVRQMPFEAFEVADDLFTVGFARSETRSTLEVDYGDGLVAMETRPGEKGCYVNPSRSDVYMRQAGTLDLLFVTCPFPELDALLGFERGSMANAVEPLHARVHWSGFEHALATSMWAAAANAETADGLFVEQGLAAIGLSLLHAARGPHAAAALVGAARGTEDPFAALHDPRDPRLRRAVSFIEDGLDGPLHVEDIARAAALSPAQVTRSFARSLGETPARYVARRRMERAVAMLRDTARPVEAVAHACGFVSAAHFSRAFRRAHGTTPGRYRADRS